MQSRADIMVAAPIAQQDPQRDWSRISNRVWHLGHFSLESKDSGSSSAEIRIDSKSTASFYHLPWLIKVFCLLSSIWIWSLVVAPRNSCIWALEKFSNFEWNSAFHAMLFAFRKKIYFGVLLTSWAYFLRVSV